VPRCPERGLVFDIFRRKGRREKGWRLKAEGIGGSAEPRPALCADGASRRTGDRGAARKPKELMQVVDFLEISRYFRFRKCQGVGLSYTLGFDREKPLWTRHKSFYHNCLQQTPHGRAGLVWHFCVDNVYTLGKTSDGCSGRSFNRKSLKAKRLT
jgi:hypothetical protein